MDDLARLGKHVARWTRIAGEIEALRDAEIQQAAAEGMSVRQIAEATGIPRSTVHRIIRRSAD